MLYIIASIMNSSTSCWSDYPGTVSESDLVAAQRFAARDVRCKGECETDFTGARARRPNLIASSDLVISAGGTMNREAAALGVPAATIYAGEWAAVDEELVREGRLRRISTREDLQNLPIEKKPQTKPRRALHVRKEVADLILEEMRKGCRVSGVGCRSKNVLSCLPN